MAHPILNPVDFQSLRPLLPAESRFAEYLQVARREGAECVAGNGGIPDKPIPDGKCGDIPNVVRGEVIRFFAHGGNEEYPVRGSFIRLQGAWVEGELDLTHADIPYALIFHNCHFAGPVQMRHAECRELDLCGSRLAMGLEGNLLRTRGGVALCDEFVADGTVDLSNARIGRVLNCHNGKFCGGLIAIKAKMEVLVWDNVDGEGEIEISAAKADILDDNLEAWKPFEVVLDGFTYDQIFGPTDAKSRIEWLAKRPGWKSFSPLPYEQAAKVLRSMGKDIDAWDIEREKRRLEREERDSQNALKVPLLLRLWGRGIDALTDFVYRPWKTLISTILIVVVGAGLFGFADESGRIVPHQPAALASVKYQYGRVPAETPGETVARKFSGYPEFSPFWFSVDIFVPFLNLHQESFWYPAPDGGRPHWWARDKDEGHSYWFLLEWWYWLQITVGWILSSLLLLSATTVLRPRQSSGEKG